MKYIKDGISDELTEKSIVYTSGTGAIFKSGIPVGRVKIAEDINQKFCKFFSDFSQICL